MMYPLQFIGTAIFAFSAFFIFISVTIAVSGIFMFTLSDKLEERMEPKEQEPEDEDEEEGKNGNPDH